MNCLKSYFNKYTIIAKLLLIVSAIVGIVSLFVYLSLPLYLIGSFVIFKSEMVKKPKVIWIFMPLIVILIVWLAIWLAAL